MWYEIYSNILYFKKYENLKFTRLGINLENINYNINNF